MMDTEVEVANYEKTIDVRATPDQVYRALTTEMNRWWTTQTEGSLISVGDKLKVDFPPNNGHWTFEATALSPGEIVELKCIDAHHVVAGQPAEIEKEWLGTRLRWQIAGYGGRSKVEFEHQGLTPKLHCYDICNEGWGYFFANSFAAYLNTGTGAPHSTVA
ncbi:MAG: SRPBCC domain-containing protein [Paracoccaceae bacterium]|uniref:SRPBCC family protein n=1 Tax=Rhodobacterales TaxID=204455 RepID=UPI00329A310B